MSKNQIDPKTLKTSFFSTSPSPYIHTYVYTNQQLKIIETTAGSYINVDTTTPQGIARAGPKGLDLLSSNIVDSISTPILHEASTLFIDTAGGHRRGRIFTIMRDPIERAVNYFQYMQHATWDPLYHHSYSTMSLQEYADSIIDRPEFNWMTKSLVNKQRTDQLTLDDLNLAKEILRSKVLIGLLEHKVDSLLRFELYFGWNFHEEVPTTSTSSSSSSYRATIPSQTSAWQTCQEERSRWETLNTEIQDGGGDAEMNLTPGMPIYDALKERNLYDVDLYEYAKKLFEDQRVLFQ